MPPITRIIASTCLAGLISGVFFGVFGSLRLLELDSGYYAMAAKLVTQGRQVYLDFFYPQMPLWPYVYAVPFKLFGSTWTVARNFTTLLAALNAMLLFLYARERSGERWAWLSVGLFALGSLVFPWFTAIKAYAFTSLGLLGAFFLLNRKDKPPSFLQLLGAGALLSLAVQTRLYVIVVLPLALLRLDRKKGAYLVAAFAVFCLPSLILLALDPEVFLFNNLGYHSLRSRLEFWPAAAQKLKSMAALLGLETNPDLPRIYFPLLLWLALLAAIRVFIRRVVPEPALLWGAALFLASIVPTPVYPQYFSLIAPFFVISFCALSKDLTQARGLSGLLFRAGVAFASVLLLWQTPAVWKAFTGGGTGVPGIGNQETAKSWSIETMRALSRAIDRHAHPGQYVYATWSGVLLESYARPWPGSENRFGLKVADQLTEEQQRRFKVVSRTAMMNRVRRRQVPLVISGKERRKTIQESVSRWPGYELVETVEHWGVLRPARKGE